MFSRIVRSIKSFPVATAIKPRISQPVTSMRIIQKALNNHHLAHYGAVALAATVGGAVAIKKMNKPLVEKLNGSYWYDRAKYLEKMPHWKLVKSIPNMDTLIDVLKSLEKHHEKSRLLERLGGGFLREIMKDEKDLAKLQICRDVAQLIGHDKIMQIMRKQGALAYLLENTTSTYIKELFDQVTDYDLRELINHRELFIQTYLKFPHQSHQAYHHQNQYHSKLLDRLGDKHLKTLLRDTYPHFVALLRAFENDAPKECVYKEICLPSFLINLKSANLLNSDNLKELAQFSGSIRQLDYVLDKLNNIKCLDQEKLNCILRYPQKMNDLYQIITRFERAAFFEDGGPYGYGCAVIPHLSIRQHFFESIIQYIDHSEEILKAVKNVGKNDLINQEVIDHILFQIVPSQYNKVNYNEKEHEFMAVYSAKPGR